MNDEKMIKGLRTAAMIVTVILMGFTLVLQTWAFEPLRHIILVVFILLLLTIILVFDGILKDGKNMALYGSMYGLWVFNLIINLSKF